MSHYGVDFQTTKEDEENYKKLLKKQKNHKGGRIKLKENKDLIALGKEMAKSSSLVVYFPQSAQIKNKKK